MEQEHAMEIVGSDMLANLTKAELDTQITTARAYPRSIKRFRDECMDMVTLTEQIAGECIYALPRDGKNIEGPSVRFAEVIASAWGNCRAGARVVAEEKDFVVAQGAFHDLERNVAITYEVKRRITDKNGKRYKPDMIGVTANAACSVALRNAILKGVPKAFWSDMYEAARKTVMGDAKTLTNRRAEALTYLQKLGATSEMVCKKLGVSGVEDIGLEELVVLRGLATAIKDGDTTVEQAFADEATDTKAEEVKARFQGIRKESKPAPTLVANEKTGLDPWFLFCNDVHDILKDKFFGILGSHGMEESHEAKTLETRYMLSLELMGAMNEDAKKIILKAHEGLLKQLKVVK